MDPRAETLAIGRLRVFARICLGWGIFLFLRLIDLQILEHQKYARQAQQQHEREVEIRAPRGSILDRNGQPLAMSGPVESVCINPLRLPDAVVAAELFSKVLHIDTGELLGRIASAVEARRGFMWVKRKIMPEEARRLRSFGVEWIEFRTESSRYYPKGERLAHVLGGVDHEEKGNAGIELALNKDLQGRPGLMRTTADVRQAVFEERMFTDPQPGADVTLTIDERIQYVAERELAAAVRTNDARTGSLVVMRPATGDILAMANYPTYNPNIAPAPGEKVDNRKNLAVTAPFEPGSVFKVITLAAALDTTRLRPSSSFHCGNGSFTLFRRVVHDAHPNGVLTMAEILAKSSNIGAIKIALEVGNARMYEYVRKFGFGQRTGVPLPGESPGVVRRLNRWIPSSIGSIAMGHELSATTLQLAQACSIVANGGFLVKPRLIAKKERNGFIETEGPAAPQRILKPETAIAMRQMMEGVVLEGTGKRARLDGYSSGGKTGSAQIYDYHARVYTHRYNGSYMGFAPVTNPAIVVVVTLNGTPSGDRGFGGRVAAPVFRNVASSALRLLDVPRDVPEIESENSEDEEPLSDLAAADLGEPPEQDASTVIAASAPENAAADLAVTVVSTGPKVPDFYGKTKRAVLQQSWAMGVRVEIVGGGIARSQDPPPGVALRPGERVRVRFSP